jgi:hypothetical protein
MRRTRPARMLRIKGLMMRKKGVLGMTGVFWFMALLKDLAGASVKEGMLLGMMNDEESDGFRG